jgi:hypothetical protein
MSRPSVRFVSGLALICSSLLFDLYYPFRRTACVAFGIMAKVKSKYPRKGGAYDVRL